VEHKTCRHKVLAGVWQLRSLGRSVLKMDWLCAPSFKQSLLHQYWDRTYVHESPAKVMHAYITNCICCIDQLSNKGGL